METDSSWSPSGICVRSTIVPHINDLVNELKCDVRIFADDTSIFKIVHNVTEAYEDLKHDLSLIAE